LRLRYIIRPTGWEQLIKEGSAVVHCPKCAVEIDLDEDEVEEGEIVTCPECEAELEIVQTHPVHLNIISEGDEDEDEEDEDDDDEDDEDDEDDDLEGDDEEEADA
jgi:alpha-aminoadipate carrier protein LysW